MMEPLEHFIKLTFLVRMTPIPMNIVSFTISICMSGIKICNKDLSIFKIILNTFKNISVPNWNKKGNISLPKFSNIPE